MKEPKKVGPSTKRAKKSDGLVAPLSGDLPAFEDKVKEINQAVERSIVQQIESLNEVGLLRVFNKSAERRYSLMKQHHGEKGWGLEIYAEYEDKRLFNEQEYFNSAQKSSDKAKWVEADLGMYMKT